VRFGALAERTVDAALSWAPLRKAVSRVLTSVSSNWSWPWMIRESFTGAWQRNEVETDNRDGLLRFSAVYACVTGISYDIAKMRVKLNEVEDSGLRTEIVRGSPYLPVLRKPNHYQTRIKFLEQWVMSKLLYGAAFILKLRDERGVVTALYPLNPERVEILVADNGDVFYRLKLGGADSTNRLARADELGGEREDGVIVPAREIIHDTMICLWHPLIGVSPLYACALAATLGNRAIEDSALFFANRSLPSGVLTAPGAISQTTADRVKETWESNYGGNNFGRVAVLGDGLRFEAIRLTAEAAQLAEQLQWTVEDVARAFHYPLFKLGGPMPPYAGNVDAMITAYYTDCLQILIENIEEHLRLGLGLPEERGKTYGIELDLDGLMRMDTQAIAKYNTEGTKGAWLMPNEARLRVNKPPVEGGDTPYMQQQNYSLAALAKRDARDDPFALSGGGTTSPPPPVRDIRSKLLDKLRSAA
jgi:HK97 family phage portal protein